MVAVEIGELNPLSVHQSRKRLIRWLRTINRGFFYSGAQVQYFSMTRSQHSEYEGRNLRTSQSSIKSKLAWTLISWLLLMIICETKPSGAIFRLTEAHIVLTKSHAGQSLVLSDEDGKGDKGGGDNLVISGNSGDGASTNMIMQDAANREGDVIIEGNNMIVPGEDGHIVLANSKGHHGSSNQGPPPNLLAFWLPYMQGSSLRRMLPFFGGSYG